MANSDGRRRRQCALFLAGFETNALTGQAPRREPRLVHAMSTRRARARHDAQRAQMREAHESRGGRSQNWRNRAGAPPAHLAQRYETIALVLQGGGALGAYQCGVYEGLHGAGIRPNWFAGISIGALNAAILAGNSPEDRIERLHAFWNRISDPRCTLRGRPPLAAELLDAMPPQNKRCR